MRDEARRRLDRALLMQKVRWAGMALATVGVAAALLYWEDLDASIARTRSVEGTVTYVGPIQGKAKVTVAATNLEVDVKLDDTRVARLTITPGKEPKVGDHLTIAEKIHGSGRRTFDWR